jgi:hypothetical protein
MGLQRAMLIDQGVGPCRTTFPSASPPYKYVNVWQRGCKGKALDRGAGLCRATSPSLLVAEGKLIK